jgi:hypothetical protein
MAKRWYARRDNGMGRRIVAPDHGGAVEQHVAAHRRIDLALSLQLARQWACTVRKARVD